MIDRIAHGQAVEQIVPSMFESIRDDFRYPVGYNLAASNQCHMLTRGLYMALRHRGLEAKREFHQDDDVFHYVINHHPVSEVPDESDIITDLNPWQFMKQQPAIETRSYLHGSRGEIMERLREEGAPDYFIALRGLATVVIPHTLAMNDFIVQRPHVA